MKVNIQGYDIECTPEEFKELLSLQLNEPIKYTPPPHYPPYQTGTPWWGIYPPTEITCGGATDTIVSWNVSLDNGVFNADEFSKKFIEGLQSKGLRLAAK